VDRYKGREIQRRGEGQQLRTMEIAAIKEFKPVATIDSPFAESIVARFSRYFNRLGTPDLDKDVVLSRLQGSEAGAKR
jgi:hypothetical protein